MSEPFDEQAAMQHFLICGNEDCEENGQFYCNDCHRPLCEQCRDQHQKSPNTKTTKPVPPVYTVGQFNKNDITKLLGKVSIPKTKPEKRQIQPLNSKAVSTNMKSAEKQLEHRKEKSDMRQTLSLPSIVVMIREYIVPGVHEQNHVSVDKAGHLLVLDWRGTLVQIDLQGNQLYTIKTTVGNEAYHTATENGDVVFSAKDEKVIYRITPDKEITEFFKTGDWEPLAIHSCSINGYILVGMTKDNDAKVTRYSKTGKVLQNIQRDNQGQNLYCYPRYIKENINGDICTSVPKKNAVVVVNKSGQHKFSYRGQGSRLIPFGICTHPGV